MTESPSPFYRILKALPVLYVAAVVAAVFLYMTVWIRQHDNPRNVWFGKDEDITYQGKALHVTLTCDCPAYLIEHKTRTLPFKIVIKSVSPNRSLAANAPVDDIDVSIEAGSATVEPEAANIGDSQDLLQSGQLSRGLSLNVTFPDTELATITFDFFPLGETTKSRYTLGSVEWGIESRSAAWTVLELYVYSIAIFAVIAGLYSWTARRLRQAREQGERRFDEAKSQADANPGQARFAWNMARFKLEEYFNRNLIQVNLVFWLAVCVMAIGFGFVLGGIVLSHRSPNEMKPALVAAISGIITQFIGATFMVIYRSTMAQANEFMNVLERINNAGMAVQVLDALPDGTEQKNVASANISALLLGGKLTGATDQGQASGPSAVKL